MCDNERKKVAIVGGNRIAKQALAAMAAMVAEAGHETKIVGHTDSKVTKVGKPASKIIKNGRSKSEILRAKCREVNLDEIDSVEVQNCIFALKNTFDGSKMLGLAAPQIGYDLRIFITHDGIIINPSFESVNDVMVSVPEGCLSVPGPRYEVDRFNSIRVKYYDEEGAYMSGELRGTNSRVFQHEYDHLDGILFTDKKKPVRIASLFRIKNT